MFFLTIFSLFSFYFPSLFVSLISLIFFLSTLSYDIPFLRSFYISIIIQLDSDIFIQITDFKLNIECNSMIEFFVFFKY